MKGRKKKRRGREKREGLIQTEAQGWGEKTDGVARQSVQPLVTVYSRVGAPAGLVLTAAEGRTG